ncbi:NAD-specific glutamate dehydrogenase-domain-containing protein [Flagelloscypha sp. PMI_526]|nr:NAD-specific glutamate dehydrogenase-domain-containing protein [Flagelloscypha sp. PMI_526]
MIQSHLPVDFSAVETLGMPLASISNFDLGNTTGRWRNTRELELAKQVLGLGMPTLTLEGLDEHTRLVAGVGEESLELHLHGGITLNKSGHDTAGSLNSKGKKGPIEREAVPRERIAAWTAAPQVPGLPGLTESLALCR